MVLTLPYLTVSGWMAVERLSGKASRFQHTLSCFSPSGHRKFVADSDGKMQILNVKTNTIVAVHQGDTEEYSGVAGVKWISESKVEVTLPLRYPGLVSGYTFIWDVPTGSWLPIG